jgi:L-threonylcarbamoyladenylate synthase
MIVEATPQNIEHAAKLLRAGEIVAFPTETVYGLGAHALDQNAVAKIFEAKQRPAFNPLIVHVYSVHAARKVLSCWPEKAEALANVFWPGPLTLVLPKTALVPANVTAGLPSVGIRIPSHPVAQALLRVADIPIAAPSANTFMHISPTRAQHVAKSLGERVPLILDGGAVPIGIESTVVSLCEEEPVLLRPGAVSRREIEAVIGPLREAKVLSDSSARSSPGMIERHYAPRARTVRFEVGDALTVHAVAKEHRSCGALLMTKSTFDVEHAVSMPPQVDLYASKLYAALHELEDAGCDLILIEMPPLTPEWHSVRDRLQRASELLS